MILDDLQKEWLAGKGTRSTQDAAGLFDTSRGVVPQGMPAGYYQLPGQQGAYYYDPRSGQVSKEFADYAASDYAKHPLTGQPTALMDQRDGGDVFRATEGQSPETISRLNQMFAIGKGADGTYQDAQDQVLGLGKYQQSLVGIDGKRTGMPTAGATVRDISGAYTDRSVPSAGAFERLGVKMGKTGADLDAALGLGGATKTTGQYADYWTSMRDSMAANYERNALGASGLRDVRTARGLDPATGTSDAERARIFETYNRITDPAQKAAYIKAQDPGNLTGELREARKLARGPDDAMVRDQATRTQYTSASRFGGPANSGNNVKLTIGGQTDTDAVTGREMYTGNIPIKAEVMKRKFNTMDRVAGGLGKVALAYMTGGYVGAALMGLQGAGVGFKVSLSDFGSIHSMKKAQFGRTEVGDPSMSTSYKEVGTALAFAAVFGTGGFGRVGGLGPSANFVAGASWGTRAAFGGAGVVLAKSDKKGRGIMG